MTNRIVTDISNYIFVSDEPAKSDAIFLPGGSHPEQPEYVAELYHQGYAKWLVASGGISVKRDKWRGYAQKQIFTTEITSLTGSFLKMFFLKTVFLRKPLSEKISPVTPAIMRFFPKSR